MRSQFKDANGRRAQIKKSWPTSYPCTKLDVRIFGHSGGSRTRVRSTGMRWILAMVVFAITISARSRVVILEDWSVDTSSSFLVLLIHSVLTNYRAQFEVQHRHGWISRRYRLDHRRALHAIRHRRTYGLREQILLSRRESRRDQM